MREERVVKKKKEQMHEGSWPRDRKLECFLFRGCCFADQVGMMLLVDF